MSNYRRLYIPGGTYAFTLVTYKRRPILTTDLARTCLRQAWNIEQKRRPFETIAVCLLPEHLHMMITLPENDINFSMRIRNIKRRFTQTYLKNGGTEAMVTASKMKHNNRGVWQRRFWEHYIRDEKDFNNHLDYIHFNPVKHGLVERCADWPYSTFHRYVQKGWYEKEWGEAELESLLKMNFGE